MKNRLVSALAVALLGLTFSATASFAADPTDAATDVAVDPVDPLATDLPVDAVAYSAADPTATDTPTDVVVDDPAAIDPAADAGAEVSPEAMRALTMGAGAPMAANAPAEEDSSSPVLPIALAAVAAAGAGYLVRRRKVTQ